jgi:hypothetical protein
VSHEASGRLDYAGGADGHEHGAAFKFVEDSIHFERHLAEPADVRTNFAAAITTREFGRWFAGVCVWEGATPAAVAAAFE